MAQRTKRPYYVDATSFSAVAVCEIDGCTYRGASNTHLNALRMLARHIWRCHPERGDYANAATQAAVAMSRRRRGK